MPELPEVEVVKRSLEKKILNLIIQKVKINDSKLRYNVNKEKIYKLKGKKIEILGTEGTESKDWILIDVGEVIINIMSEDSREHYDLESLWDRRAK